MVDTMTLSGVHHAQWTGLSSAAARQALAMAFSLPPASVSIAADFDGTSILSPGPSVGLAVKYFFGGAVGGARCRLSRFI